MTYHVSSNKNNDKPLPLFMIHNGELVCPKKLFTRNEYPGLQRDMVKISGMNGQVVFIPLSKLAHVSTMDV